MLLYFIYKKKNLRLLGLITTKIVDLDAFNNLFDKEKDFIVLPEDLEVISFPWEK